MKQVKQIIQKITSNDREETRNTLQRNNSFNAVVT